MLAGFSRHLPTIAAAAAFALSPMASSAEEVNPLRDLKLPDITGYSPSHGGSRPGLRRPAR